MSTLELLEQVMRQEYAPRLHSLMERLASRYLELSGKLSGGELMTQKVIDLAVASEWGGVQKQGGYAPEEITAKERLTIPGAFAFFMLLFPDTSELFDVKHVGVNRYATYRNPVCTGITVVTQKSSGFSKENIVTMGVPVCSSLGCEHGGVSCGWWEFGKGLFVNGGDDGAVATLNEWGAASSIYEGPFILDVDEAIVAAGSRYEQDCVVAARKVWDVRMAALEDLATKVLEPLLDAQAYRDAVSAMQPGMFERSSVLLRQKDQQPTSSWIKALTACAVVGGLGAIVWAVKKANG